MAKTDFMVVSISDSGEATALHRDCFDLAFLGKQSILRASDIRFDEATQKWDIHLNVGAFDPDYRDGDYILPPTARGLPTYELARDVEVEWLEQSKLAEAMPYSEFGLRLLIAARLKMGV